MTTATPLLRAAARLVSPGGVKGKLTILTYHRVLTEADPLLPSNQVDARKFSAHMAAVAQCFNVLPFPEALERMDNGTLPPRALSITFDDGYRDNHAVALPILQRHGLKATFFVCSGYLNNGLMFNDVITEAVRSCQSTELDLSWLGLGIANVGNIEAKRTLVDQILSTVKYLPFNAREDACRRLWDTACPSPAISRPQLMMTDEQIRDLAKHGMTIGAHTHTHPILNQVGLASARQDIEQNRRLLKDLTGETPQIFAYPNGRPVRDYGHQHVKLLQEMGFRAAVTTAWGVASRACDPHQLPRFSPWDDNAQRLVMRLIKNAVVGQHPLTAPDVG